ncbi:MAG: radical SAM protein [Candidatus Lokiarchaeota archaeon]|nr:radical SAM protein [Candidatus Lokiarchaeota archaeon]
MQIAEKPTLFKIQRTCVYDGPGIRTTIFFQGCNLRCKWCQNPEGQSFQEDAISQCDYTIDEIIDIISRDKKYYLSTEGGVTLSGGEPLLQKPKALLPLLKMLKKDKIKITAETSLFAPWDNISKFAQYIDLFLVDLKIVGNDKLHKELTNQTSELIQDNLKKLIESGANIKFRMVMVPGMNDTEANIKNTANLLKSFNYDSIELLKYHSLYEDKTKRLGLKAPLLNITSEESLASLKKGIKMFKENGISAQNSDLDHEKHETFFSDRVKKVQNDILNSKRALCMEAAKLRTKYYRKNGFKKPTPIHRSERLSYVLANKKLKVYPKELLVGNFTSKRLAGQMWEEYYGTLYILFLYRINRQKPVPFQCSLKDRLYFYTRIFPYWVNHSLIKMVYPTVKGFIVNMARTAELVAGFNNNMAAIAHFIVNYDRLLKLGTTGLIKEIRKKQKEHPENNQDFYEGAILGLKGLEVFAKRYADYLAEESEKETDPERKAELKKMSEICSHVPKNPARTLHEALQSILLLHIALCIEQYENAISFGRLDQILYPYYKNDKEAGRITYEEAKELICLFALKIDELILANDGDSMLQMSNMFETVSTDQALTFGGVDKDGNDATNDVTYMLIDACELQTVSLDMGARIHKNSPQKYLERLAEVYISGCPIPQLFSDDIYIKTLLKHYDTTIEDARNYSIVGCVEPCASDDHFGNTDCANVNLALPFLQALKGQKYDLWNHKLIDHILIVVLEFLKFLINARWFDKIIDKLFKLRNINLDRYKYNPPQNMEELLDRFQKRLNEVTESILRDHQHIEARLRQFFPAPLASSLYDGCLEKGKDLYEGGSKFNSSGIQAVGVTDVADSLYAIDEVVFKKKQYSLNTVINAIENNFKGKKYQKVRAALLAVPKFGDDSSTKATEWENKVLDIYNKALQSVDKCPRNGRYSAGYYALNVCNRYGKKTPALPSGRLNGQPLANSITPHYGMQQNDLLSAMNAISGVDFVEHAENGTTVTFTIDSALFQGEEGKKKLANMLKTFLTTGGMQMQPNVVNRELLIDAYNNPDKYPHLLVRIAGYCEYFNQLSDEMKRIVINRTCYTS